MSDLELPKKGVGFDIEVADVSSVAPSEGTTISLSSTVPEEETEAVAEEHAPVKEQSFDTVPALNAYQIKPDLQDKFKANPVKEVIRNVLTTTLTGKTYDSDNAKRWTIKIANDVNTKVRELKMRRYKHIAQVIIGEMKGAGVKCGVRCLWDSETDGYTSDIFMNETIFCVTVVFAVYLY